MVNAVDAAHPYQSNWSFFTGCNVGIYASWGSVVNCMNAWFIGNCNPATAWVDNPAGWGAMAENSAQIDVRNSYFIDNAWWGVQCNLGSYVAATGSKFEGYTGWDAFGNFVNNQGGIYAYNCSSVVAAGCTFTTFATNCIPTSFNTIGNYASYIMSVG